MKKLLFPLAVLALILTACGGRMTPEQRVEKFRQQTEAKKFESARESLKVLMVEKPTDPTVLFYAGKMYFDMERYDSAQSYLKKYTALYPNDANGYRLLYDASEKLEDYDSQLWALSQLGYIENNRKPYLPRIAELNLRNGNPGMAIAVCRDILKYDSTNWHVWFTMATGLMAIDKSDSAIQILEKLDKLVPNQLEIISNLGIYYAAIKKYDKAEERFGQATVLFPDFMPGWFGLGNVLAAKGDTTGAIEAYRRVYASDSSFLGVDTLLRNLNGL